MVLSRQNETTPEGGNLHTAQSSTLYITPLHPHICLLSHPSSHHTPPLSSLLTRHTPPLSHVHFLLTHHTPPQVDKAKMKQGSRVSLDMTTLTIMRQLPREVDPLVYSMSIEDPGDVGYSSVGGLSEQIRELREVRACLLYPPSFILRNNQSSDPPLLPSLVPRPFQCACV